MSASDEQGFEGRRRRLRELASVPLYVVSLMAIGALACCVSSAYDEPAVSVCAVTAPGETENELVTVSGVTAGTSVEVVGDIYPYHFGTPMAGRRITLVMTEPELVAFEEARRVVIAELGKYPPAVLQNAIDTVHIVGSITVAGIQVGGTYEPGRIYVATMFDGERLPPCELALSVHHELSSHLLKANLQHFDEAAWRAHNPIGFQYLRDNPEFVHTKALTDSVDASVNEQGFVREYSLASVEDDFNCIAEELFCPVVDLWEMKARHPRLSAKIDAVVRLYEQVDSAFTEEAFRAFTPPRCSCVACQAPSPTP